MSAQILNFLYELQANNNREWFQANKDRFDVLKKDFTETVQQLINRIGLFDPEVAGIEAKDCVYRIYRDVRFSPNKLPYKNHFAAYIAQGGRKSERAGYYLHIEPGNSLLSGGLWQPQPKLLKMLRRDLYDQIEEFQAILDKPSFKKVFPGLEGEKLKRMPAGYPAEGLHKDVLLYKDFCVSSQKPDRFF